MWPAWRVRFGDIYPTAACVAAAALPRSCHASGVAWFFFWGEERSWIGDFIGISCDLYIFPRGTMELRAAAYLMFDEFEKQNPTSYLCT